nr:transcription factor bHLH121 [Ipomoea batatas]
MTTTYTTYNVATDVISLPPTTLLPSTMLPSTTKLGYAPVNFSSNTSSLDKLTQFFFFLELKSSCYPLTLFNFCSVYDSNVTTIIEQPSTLVSPTVQPSSWTHCLSKQDSRHKLDQEDNRIERGEDSNEVAIDLELKTLGSTSEQVRQSPLQPLQFHGFFLRNLYSFVRQSYRCHQR